MGHPYRTAENEPAPPVEPRSPGWWAIPLMLGIVAMLEIVLAAIVCESMLPTTQLFAGTIFVTLLGYAVAATAGALGARRWIAPITSAITTTFLVFCFALAVDWSASTWTFAQVFLPLASLIGAFLGSFVGSALRLDWRETPVRRVRAIRIPGVHAPRPAPRPNVSLDELPESQRDLVFMVRLRRRQLANAHRRAA